MILLDTHVLIWMSSDPNRLSKKAREAIRNARQKTGVAVASITLWELAWAAENHRIWISGSAEIVAVAVRLPPEFPKDPADRLIASTAMVDGIPLVTADARIRNAKVADTIW